MTRLPDWSVRLEVFVMERNRTVFAWGSNDCCTFAFDAVKAITGEDPAPHLRDHVDEMSAARSLKTQGGVEAIADKVFGQKIIPALASVGDIGLVTTKGRESLAVCGGDTWFGPGENGLVHVPLLDGLSAWRCC